MLNSVSGTSLLTMRWARPSTMAVLPTPGSPMSTGLFLVRRERTCMIRSISFSRPMTGSSLPSRASWVRLRPNWSRTGEPVGASEAAPPNAGPDRFFPLIAGHQLDDLLADPTQVGPQAYEDLGSDALPLADHAEQHVLGTDVAVSELKGLAQRQLEDLFGSRRERRRARRGRSRHADGLFDLLAHGLEGDAEGLERLGSDALALVDQPQEDVLRADEAVIEQARLLLRQHKHPPGPVGEAFEHSDRLHLGCLCQECTGAPPRHCQSGRHRAWCQVPGDPRLRLSGASPAWARLSSRGQ